MVPSRVPVAMGDGAPWDEACGALGIARWLGLGQSKGQKCFQPTGRVHVGGARLTEPDPALPHTWSKQREEAMGLWARVLSGGHNIVHMQSSIVTSDLRVWASSVARSKEMGNIIVLRGAKHLQSEGNQSDNFISH